MVSETYIESRFAKWCREQGWACDKMADLTEGGHPDRTIRFGYGATVYIEFKHPDRVMSLRPDQKNYIRRMLKRGELVLVTNSLDEAKEWTTACHKYLFRIDTRIQPSDLLSKTLSHLVQRVELPCSWTLGWERPPSC